MTVHLLSNPLVCFLIKQVDFLPLNSAYWKDENICKCGYIPDS